MLNLCLPLPLTQDELLAAAAAGLPREDAQDRHLRAFDWLERGQAGAVEAAVAKMTESLASAEMQKRGCLALQALHTQNTSTQRNAVTAGAIEAVLAAMREHTGHAGVQEAGCAAVAKMINRNAINWRRQAVLAPLRLWWPPCASMLAARACRAMVARRYAAS